MEGECRRRIARPQTLAGDAAHRADRAELRTSRSDLSSPPAPGVAALGLRQPHDLTAFRPARSRTSVPRMRYVSTRGPAPVRDFAGVLLAGLAEDGGLYVPESWPHFSPADWRAMRGLPYRACRARDPAVRRRGHRLHACRLCRDAYRLRPSRRRAADPADTSLSCRNCSTA